MATLHKRVYTALELISETAHNLAIHGQQGYDTSSSYMDYTLARALAELHGALEEAEDNDTEYFDPKGHVFMSLTGEWC